MISRASSTSSTGNGGPRPRALVVTPDGPARRLAVSALEAAGYNTLDTDDGRQALHLLVDHGERLAVAVVSTRLPILAGCELTDFVRRFFPALPLVHLAPRDAAEAADPGMLGDGLPTLATPFTADELLRSVESARRRLERQAISTFG